MLNNFWIGNLQNHLTYAIEHSRYIYQYLLTLVLNNNKLFVSQAYTKVDTGYDFHEPKTASSERSIALSENTVSLLSDYQKAQELKKDQN